MLILVETYDGVASGPGFSIGGNTVATCAHVVEGARRILVITADGNKLWANPGPTDPLNDVALVLCPPGLPAPVVLGKRRRRPRGG